MLIFLDTEFTDLLNPQLLSLGLVTQDGREHYVELDLQSPIGTQRGSAASDFVKHEGVLDQWGRLPGAASTEWEMGRRTGEWLLARAAERPPEGQTPDWLEIAFDYATDYELLEEVIREAGLWSRVRELVRPVNIAALVGTIEGELASEAAFREMEQRGLKWHHALADAQALRAAYLAVTAGDLGRWRGIT